MTNALPSTIRFYLGRLEHILARIEDYPDPKRLLAHKLAPDMFDTGLNMAIAIQFAARALCPPSGCAVPEIPDRYTPETLKRQLTEVSTLIADIHAEHLIHTVHHEAGEAEIVQEPIDYITRFALPNMIFHTSIAYAGLRTSGLDLGKADFDGQHHY